MNRKVFIYVFGVCLITLPIFAACFKSTIIWCALVAYCIILWHSPKFSPIIKRFWRNFWKIQKSLEMSLEEYEN